MIAFNWEHLSNAVKTDLFDGLSDVNGVVNHLFEGVSPGVTLGVVTSPDEEVRFYFILNI